MREGLRLLEQGERENKALIEWLRSATKEATDSIDRGEGIGFETMDELAAYVHQVGREVSAEVTGRRKRV